MNNLLVMLICLLSWISAHFLLIGFALKYIQKQGKPVPIIVVLLTIVCGASIIYIDWVTIKFIFDTCIFNDVWSFNALGE
jgi:hypothetical protein